MSVLKRIQNWQSHLSDKFDRVMSWALYNESGGAFDLSIPGVREGKWTPGDEHRPPSKRSKLSRAVGLSNEPGDSGGFTKFGFAQNAHRGRLDVASMTFDDAKREYRRLYWEPCRCDELPYEVAFQVFDAAVGSGPDRAIRLLQRTVGAKEDGKFGPATLAAVKKANEDAGGFAERFSAVRIAFADAIIRENPSQKKWESGWKRRWSVVKFEDWDGRNMRAIR